MGSGVVSAISLAGICLVTIGFRHEKFCCFLGGIFCAMLCPTLYKIMSVIFRRKRCHMKTKSMRSREATKTGFGLIYVSAKQIRLVDSLCRCETNGHYRTSQKNQKCLISSPVHLSLTNHRSSYKIKIGIENKQKSTYYKAKNGNRTMCPARSENVRTSGNFGGLWPMADVKLNPCFISCSFNVLMNAEV